jgi:YD repeat-containing protein
MTRLKTVLVLTIFINFLIAISFAATYQYDSLNRLSKVTYNDGTRIVYTYDASGNRSAKVVTVLADLDVDVDVDFLDFAKFASHWLDNGCEYPDFCGDADFDWSSEVGIEDLAIFASHWLER